MGSIKKIKKIKVSRRRMERKRATEMKGGGESCWPKHFVETPSVF